MKNLLGVLLKAQQEFPTIVKDATNPAFRSRYATLAAVQEAAFPILYKYGLAVLQSVRTEMTEHGLMVHVGATLYHAESGEQITQELGLIPTRADPQGVGSAITYGRRYLLMTMLGLAADDDDANAASEVGSMRFAPGARQSAPARSASSPARTRVPAAAEAEAATPGDDRPQWHGVAEAVEWSVDLGAFDDENAARGELKRILQSIYPGRESCKPHELPVVLDAWYAEVRRLLARGKAAAEAKPASAPASAPASPRQPASARQPA